MGRKRKATKAQMRLKYYDATKRLGAVHHPYHDNHVMMPPYSLAPPPFYVSHTSYPPNAYGRGFSVPPPSHFQEVNSQDIVFDIPAAVTKEEDDDPKSLDNKRIIASSVPSSELEVALKAELDKEVKNSERISAELGKLRQVLSRIQAHQSYEPLPPHGASLHTSHSRTDRSEQKPPQPTKKGPRNGYNMYYSKIAPELKGTLNSYKDLAKVISEKWSQLSKEEKDNYELDAEIFNIMDDRDTRNSNSNSNSNGDDQRRNEYKQSDSDDVRDDQHLYYPPTNPPYQYQYDMTIPPPPGPPPGPPPPGMLFDLSVPPPPPPPGGYDYSVLPPPPPNDMFGGGVPPPPPNYTDIKLPTSASALNFEDTGHDSPPLPLNRSQSLY